MTGTYTAHGDHMDDWLSLYTWISKTISSKLKKKKKSNLFSTQFSTVFLNTWL